MVSFAEEPTVTVAVSRRDGRAVAMRARGRPSRARATQWSWARARMGSPPRSRSLARGWRSTIFEGAESPGGGCRTEELTLPGFRHDLCSSVHPLLAASPFFREAALPGVSLKGLGGRLRAPARSRTSRGGSGHARGNGAGALGGDANAYRRLLEPLIESANSILSAVLAPLLRLPAHPIALARFGLHGLLPITLLAREFKTEEARALLAGLGAHAMQPLSAPGTGAFALLLGMLAHTVGWPVIEGGSARLTEAMLEALSDAGGELHAGQMVNRLEELPSAEITMLDVSTQGLLELGGERLPRRYRSALRRFRYGPGACKVDWALDGPVPWEAEVCRRAPTLHLGGSLRGDRPQRGGSRERAPSGASLLHSRSGVCRRRESRS